MRRKTKKRLKEHLSLYNITIFVAMVLMIAAIIFIFATSEHKTTDNNQAKSDTNQNISTPQNTNVVQVDENEARVIAVNKFKELGETIEKDKLNVVEIERGGQKCYFISSKSNTMEVSMSTGKITRLNSIAQ